MIKLIDLLMEDETNPFPTSKTKDKLYRGVQSKFDPKRDSNLDWSGKEKREGHSIYFSFDRDFAESQYAKGPQGEVIEAFINTKNPWDYKDGGDRQKLINEIPPEDYEEDMRGWLAMRLSQGDWGIIEKYLHLIKEMGYDSAKLNELGSDNIIVFDPKQIKYIGY